MNIHTYLIEHGLTEAQFSERIGVCQSTVSKWRHGRRTPRPRIMRRIIEATDGNVGPGDFMQAAGS